MGDNRAVVLPEQGVSGEPYVTRVRGNGSPVAAQKPKKAASDTDGDACRVKEIVHPPRAIQNQFRTRRPLVMVPAHATLSGADAHALIGPGNDAGAG